MLKAHLNEISDVLDAIIEGLLEAFAPILFWKGKAAAVSLSVCLLWQWLVSHPRFIPACLPMIGIIFLQRSYTRSERGARMNGGGSSSGRQAEGCNSAGIAARPGAIELLKALVLNKTPKPLTAGPITNEPPTAEAVAAERTVAEPIAAEPVAAGGPTSQASNDTGDASNAGNGASGAGKGTDGGGDISGSGSDSDDDETAAKSKSAMKSAALDLKVVKRFTVVKGSLKAKIKEIRRQVTEEVHEMESDVQSAAEEGEADTRLAGAMGGAMNKVRNLSPLAMALGPAQTALGKLIIPLRTAERILNWHDRAATLWLYLCLVATSIVLAIIPWTLVCRIVGFGVLGPHMHLVGRALDKRSLAAAKREREFAGADAGEREKILMFVRAEAMATAKKKLDKIRTKLDARTKSVVAQDEFVSNAKFNLIIQPSRTQSRIRDKAKPSPTRSKAYPAPEGW